VIDFGRAVLTIFWRSASPDEFLRKAGNSNVTYANRNADAAMAFVGRIKRSLDKIF
jgi:hypothetical protein